VGPFRLAVQIRSDPGGDLAFAGGGGAVSGFCAQAARPVDPARSGREDPGYFSRLTVGFLGTLLPTLGLWLFLVLIYALYSYSRCCAAISGLILLTMLLGIGVMIPDLAAVRGGFRAASFAWRLVRVSDPRRGRLKLLVIIMAVTIVADEVITQILERRGRLASDHGRQEPGQQHHRRADAANHRLRAAVFRQGRPARPAVAGLRPLPAQGYRARA
jgi:hypothetical protein